MKVLVTGAGGLIGSYTVRALHNGGHEVTALYRNVPPRKEGYPWNIMKLDLLESRSDLILESISADVVVHCAAVLPSQFDGEEAGLVAAINRQIDERIVKSCEHKDCLLIYMSSGSVHGLRGSPWTEESPVYPQGAYALAKFETEQKILELINRCIIFRISAPYGAEQRNKTVLRTFIERALANLDLQYHGSGKRQQDFIAAADVARAIVHAVLQTNAKGIFNIASGSPISMKDLAELVVRIVSRTTSKIVPSGQPDVQEDYRAWFDTSKAKREIGWYPTISLDKGIRNWVNYLTARVS